MQHKLRSCIFKIIISFIVICWGATIQAEEITAKNKSASTSSQATTSGSKTTTASTATTNNATTNADKVALVNGKAIRQDQFDNALAYQKQIAAENGATISYEQIPQLKYELLQSLIGTELLYQESQKQGIKVEEKEINEAYEAQKQKAQFKTDAEFEAALKQTNKTIASYKAEIKQGLANDHFVKNKFTDNTVISDSEAKKYYDDNPSYFQQPAKVRVSHIMIRVDSNADQSKKDEAKIKIEQVMKRLKAGENFAALAKEVSEDMNSKKNGGDLDYFSKGQIGSQTFEDAAFALKKDEISNIVETNAGYHIMKLTDKTDAKKVSFEEAKNDIIDSLKSTKVNSNVNRYIIEMKNKATIETFPVSK
jgi:peptidyl-prolyl cis-trans isomerase C